MGTLAWKFIGADHRLGYRDGRELRAGETLTGPLDGDGKPIARPVLCEHGFHASVSARDALGCVRGGMNHVARVEIGGVVAAGDDKIAGTEIKCLWIADATQALRLFAVRRRKKQVEYRLCGREPSMAVVWALDCAERFVLGDADDDERQAAYVAAAAAAAVAAYVAAAAAVAAAAYAAAAADAAAYAAAAADAAEYAAAAAAAAAAEYAAAAADAAAAAAEYAYAAADAERKNADAELTAALEALHA